MAKDELVFLLFIMACILSVYFFIKDRTSKSHDNKRICKIRESIIQVNVDYKGFREGSSYSLGTGGALGYGRLPNTYMLIVSTLNSKEYIINDKELFEKCNIGDTIELKLIEKLDEYNFVISYELQKINTRPSL